MKLEEIRSIIENSEFVENKDSAQLINLVLSVYKENRIDNTDLEADGDMLLFQWGIYDLEGKSFLEIDIARQILPDLEDIDEATDGMQQLSTNLKYSTNDTTSSFTNSNEWCDTPNKLNEFSQFIENNEAYKWAIQNKPLTIEIAQFFI